MYDHRSLRGMLLLVALLLTGCSSPEAAVPPTAALPAPAPIVTTPAPTPAPTTTIPARPVASGIPEAILQPTELSVPESRCPDQPFAADGMCKSRMAGEQPTPDFSTPSSVTIVKLVAPITPAPTLSIPLDQALRQLGEHQFLYITDTGALLLTDITGHQQLQVDAQVCPLGYKFGWQAGWSADGRFIAVICFSLDQELRTYPQASQVSNYREMRIYLLDMRTGAIRLAAQGPAVSFAWSRVGSHLLVNVQSEPDGPTHTSLVDAVADTRT